MPGAQHALVELQPEGQWLEGECDLPDHRPLLVLQLNAGADRARLYKIKMEQ